MAKKEVEKTESPKNWADALTRPDCVVDTSNPIVIAWLESVAHAKGDEIIGIGRMLKAEVRRQSDKEAGMRAQNWAKHALAVLKKK